MRLILFLLSILIFVAPPSLKAQQSLNYIPGEVLIRLADGYAIESFVAEIRNLPENPDLIVETEIISSKLNIYRVVFDHPKTSETAFFNLANRTKGIINIQRNHVAELRVEPNDPQYSKQWHLKNNGQTSGLPGADVSIEKAWEITTGGISSKGDTIVVAVIDTGFDFEHEDLSSNIWINHGEIPGNGIDDDNNGYIDDYYGWNASQNNGNLSSNGSHGTNVDGVIGAQGNNELGIAGVNWNIKIMHVVLTQITEANVIKAYEYVLNQRIKYNESQGQEGAFVVATNSSWGINYGSPNDAPLWCAYYDTLGNHGILNTAATANLNINVDIVGDLPTACESEYLISVTSSNSSDTRSVAGYGTKSIKIAAPGNGIFTTRNRDRYASVSGTSFASPMVAAAVALLYSVPCNKLAEMALTEPAKAAQMVRDAIYRGVDKKTAFQNTTSSGGRLNVHGALLELVEVCNLCPVPTIPALVDYQPDRLIISWDNEDEFYQGFNIQYREFGAPDWIQSNQVSSPHAISDLNACEYYEIRLQGVCDTEVSLFTPSQVFRTDSCCEAPRLIDTIFVQPNAARITWRRVLPSDIYFLEYRKKNDTDWFQIFSTGTQHLLRGLEFCTEYEIRMAVVCVLDTTEYSPIFEFKTKGCGACTEKVYCTPENGISDLTYIRQFTLNNLDMESERGPGGYEDFTGLNAEAERGKSYDFRFELGGLDSGTLVNLAIWIDYNHDGFFDDENETAFLLEGFGDSILQRRITIPLIARIGTTRMRIAVQDADLNDTIPLSCTQDMFYGEYEDYCIDILQQNCPGTPVLDTISVGITSAEIEWTPVEEAIAYTYRYREVGSTNWVEELSDTVTSYVYSGLQQCKQYEFEVRSVCLFDTSAYINLIFNSFCPTSTELTELNGFMAYTFPNPFDESLSLRIASDHPTNLRMTLYSNLGQAVKYESINIGTGESTFVWNGMSKLPPGFYFLEFMTDKGRTTRKLIKN